MKPQDITKRIYELESDSSYEGKYKIKYALASTLPDVEFMQFIEDEGFPEIYDKSLTRRGLNNRFSCRQRIAIDKEIKELSSPQCKRRVALKDNLKKRYKYAFPKDQEKVLRCMLSHSTVKERQWAYSKLTADWNKWGESFSKDILTVFEKYQDVDCANLITKHMPTSFVYQNRELLAEKVGWQRVIVATGKDYPETIDLSKLTPNEVVRTIVRLGLNEYKGFIEDTLYNNILREIEYILSAGKMDDSSRLTASENTKPVLPFSTEGALDKSYLSQYFSRYQPSGYYSYAKTLSLRDIGGVSLALWAMGRLGMADEIVRFAEYDMATEEDLTHMAEDYDTLPFKVEAWLFKAYNHILTNRYGKMPLSDDEMMERFVGKVPLDRLNFKCPENDLCQTTEVPESASEQVELMEKIGFGITKC